MNAYEKEIDCLKTQLLRINNYLSIPNSNKVSFDPTFSQWYLSNQILNENEKHQVFSNQLQEDFIRIHSLVSEANFILNEMQQNIIYNVILQIPISYLKPSERNINNLCEIAIQVKQGDSIVQIWNTDKFESKFKDIKDNYHKWKTSEDFKRNNLVFDEQSESLIGVANIYLKALFYDSKLDYIVPIINQQGERFGSLHVVLDQTESSPMRNLSDFQINSTTQGSMSEGISVDIDEQSLSNSQPSLDDEGIAELSTLSNGKNDQLTVKFSIKEVRDLPITNAECIICRYTFINPKLDQTVISIESSTNDLEQSTRRFSFDHENEYTFPITDNFLSTCFESAVSIEVWYQNKSKIQSIDTIENDKIKIREIGKYWKDFKRHIQFSVEIHELNATGQWEPVDVDTQEQILSGGIYRLKQGQSKRLVVELRVIPRSDPMPLSIHGIRSVEIGSIDTRKINAPRQLDSYQDEDLQYLKGELLELIEKKKLYLESQVNIINQQANKTPNDIRREARLIEKIVSLIEERSIAIFPPAGSGIPGAPAVWEPPENVEKHRPLIFLNMNSDHIDIAGLEATLLEENRTEMFELSLIQNASDEIRAVAVWNPSIHESTALNQVTPQDTLIYLIVKIIVVLSEPVQMEVILRKRIAVTISKSEGSWTGKIFKNFLGYTTYKRTSVVYEIVSNIPKNLYNIEDEKEPDSQCLSQDSIEKYLQYASAIDLVLLLDRLRQEVLLAENSAKQQTIRKATSAPNIAPHKKHRHIFHSPANSRRENIDISNQPIISLGQLDLNDSTPSMLARSMFIEEQQLQPIQTATFQIKHIIDLEDNKQPDDENTLELKYPMKPSQSPEQIIPKTNKDFSIGCQVIVNTGRSVCEKKGIIRFIGEFSVGKGIWYGIELEEPVGKNNGSHDGHIYFECPDKHGIFVRDDKIRLAH